MSAGFKNKNDLISNKAIEGKSEIDKKTESLPDPQVKPKKHYSTRRSFDTAYKLRILAAFDACESSVERGALLRKEGLYHSRIAAWRQQFNNSKLNNGKKKSKALRTDHLVRENEQLKKKLAQAEAIIDLQKKVSELLGKHILPNEDTE
jgi:transposase-like protein